MAEALYQGEDILLKILQGLRPQQSDLLLAGQGQNTRIHERTADHRDVDGNPFEPYNTTRPYYYRPWNTPSIGRGRKGFGLDERRKRVPEGSRTQSARSFFRRIGGRTGAENVLKHQGQVVATIEHREPDTIKFASYDAFKRALGRSGVDLTGPRAPHMMQAIQVAATDGEIRISIEDPEKAAIATGHNTGDGKNKRRHFFGASKDDTEIMLRDIANACLSRAKS